MDNFSNLSYEDLDQLCQEGAEESLTLEFKSCSELRPNTQMKHGELRTTETIKDELTRDVSSFLNSAGGRIIYGIRETKASRAKELDSNPFGPNDTKTETINQWIRHNIQPSPSVNVYRVFHKTDDTWFIVIDIPQGEQAYMARDHKFHKRVGNTRAEMEQYEVADVMNRVNGAALAICIELNDRYQRPTDSETGINIRIKVQITSENFVSSDHGAMKLTLTRPGNIPGQSAFPGAIMQQTGLVLKGYENTVPHAQSIRIDWGIGRGGIIYPDDWYDFHGNTIGLVIPSLFQLDKPTFLLGVDLYTIQRRPKNLLYALYPDPIIYKLTEVTAENYETHVNAFWATYHNRPS